MALQQFVADLLPASNATVTGLPVLSRALPFRGLSARRLPADRVAEIVRFVLDLPNQLLVFRGLVLAVFETVAEALHLVEARAQVRDIEFLHQPYDVFFPCR